MTCNCCFDRILPSELFRPLRPVLHLVSGPSRAAFEIAKLWPNGRVLRVRFIGGTTAQRDMIKRVAPEWSQHANLTFDFNPAVTTDIRIAFNDDGAWSYLGTDALKIPQSQPTMNYGWLDEAVIRHEFGHSLAMIHEHQNPRSNPIQWNRAQVIKDLSGPPNNWSESTIESNVFRKYDVNQINGSDFDAASIMLYSFPANWTLDGFHTEPNKVLSELDKSFAKRVYPGRTDPQPPPLAIELPVFEAVQAAIGQPGEEDRYTFSAATAGRYTIETDGATDLVMKLYSAEGALIAQDDDSGVGSNPRVSTQLQAGKYSLQVRHYNASRGIGSYGIRVTKG